MSLIDLGKNDISEETLALKDRLASQDTENAGLRTQLMRREAELEELRATLNETVYKLSKEAERALQLEEEASTRSSELKTERISLRNAELALQSAQDKLKAEERAKRELESTLDTVSLHSQTTNVEHQSVQREKRALESRVRELERIVQMHEAKGASNVSRKTGRPRSSSASNFRLPVVEQELNDAKAQLHSKDTNLRMLEQKLAQVQDELVKAENARISVDKASQKRISELLSDLEVKEEELESLRQADDAGEREMELLKRIDEDAAKIVALEKLVVESQVSRTSEARIQKLQSQLKAECEKLHRNEDLQNRLLHEKEDLVKQYETSQREIEEGHQLLVSRERQIKELQARQAHLLAELDACGRREEPLSLDTTHPSSQSRSPDGIAGFPNESALADHVQTLLQAIDRLRGERDELKHALEFSEVEYRITTEGFQSHVASLTRQLAERADGNPMDEPFVERRVERLASCAAAFAVVISNVQTHLDLSEDRLSMTFAELASSNSRLQEALVVIDNQKRLLDANAHELVTLLRKHDAAAKGLLDSSEECDSLRLQLTNIEEQLATSVENVKASESAREEAQQHLSTAEQRFATLSKNYQDIESQRNSLALQITNLQDDLTCAQNELANAENRCNTMTQTKQAEDAAALQVELENVRTQLQNSLENFADLEQLHDDVVRELTASKETFELRFSETEAQIRSLNVDHQHSLTAMQANLQRENDLLSNNLEEREQEVDELRQQLQDISEAHTIAEERLHEELKSRVLMNDLEKDLRQTVSDARQHLLQAEAETLALQEERELLQAQITDLQAEIQRSASLTCYLESQVRESEDACTLLKEDLHRAETTLAESEKACKVAEFNLTLQTTQHEKVVSALHREIISLQTGPELRSALADLEEKNREMDNLLRAKCQEIEEYDDRILETLKTNKRLTSKVESLTRKIQALQAKFASTKTQPQETLLEDPPKRSSPLHSPPPSSPAVMSVGSPPSSSRSREGSMPSQTLGPKTPEPQLVVDLPSSHTPGTTDEPPECEVSVGKKRPAPDDDERDSVPAEGHYSTDACLRNGPTPRLRRAHGHPAGFTPVRGSSSRKPAGIPSPGRRVNTGVAPSEIIADVTNSPRGSSGDTHLKKRSWLGKVRSGASSQTRLGTFGR